MMNEEEAEIDGGGGVRGKYGEGLVFLICCCDDSSYLDDDTIGPGLVNSAVAFGHYGIILISCRVQYLCNMGKG